MEAVLSIVFFRITCFITSSFRAAGCHPYPCSMPYQQTTCKRRGNFWTPRHNFPCSHVVCTAKAESFLAGGSGTHRDKGAGAVEQPVMSPCRNSFHPPNMRHPWATLGQWLSFQTPSLLGFFQLSLLLKEIPWQVKTPAKVKECREFGFCLQY